MIRHQEHDGTWQETNAKNATITTLINAYKLNAPEERVRSFNEQLDGYVVSEGG